MKDNCLTCKFQESNQCRRFPPQIISIPYGEKEVERETYTYESDIYCKIKQFYPIVDSTHWCGEYKPANPS